MTFFRNDQLSRASFYVLSFDVFSSRAVGNGANGRQMLSRPKYQRERERERTMSDFVLFFFVFIFVLSPVCLYVFCVVGIYFFFGGN